MNALPSGLFEDEDITPLADTAKADSPRLQLSSILIRNFKGLRETKVVLPSLAVLTGPNNCGKSSILQAISIAFECLRLCSESGKHRFHDRGRVVNFQDRLPVNHPRDLWFESRTKSGPSTLVPIELILEFSNHVTCTCTLKYNFNGLLAAVSEYTQPLEKEAFDSILSSYPVYIQSNPGPLAVEQVMFTPLLLRRLSVGEANAIIRNVLLNLQETNDDQALAAARRVLTTYFATSLGEVKCGRDKDIDLRATYRHANVDLDIVSAGSGMNQILQLALIVSWRKPAILLLDEPDSHLHPSIQHHLLRFLDELRHTLGMQVIMATHSRDIISQASVSSIVGVDCDKVLCEPLRSHEHLLLEFGRQQFVTNIDLALLYQSRCCLFVEGESDESLLMSLAERLGFPFFHSMHPIVLIPCGGADKLDDLPRIVEVFERIIGGCFAWGALRDGDARVEPIREFQEVGASRRGYPFWHQLRRYSVENYLLEPELLLRALERTRSDIPWQVAYVEDVLLQVCAELREQFEAEHTVKTQELFRQFELCERDKAAREGARESRAFLESHSSLADRLRLYPGKQVLGRFIGKVQHEYGVDLRVTTIVDACSRDLIDGEIADLFDRLAVFRDSTQREALQAAAPVQEGQTSGLSKPE